MVRLFFDVVTHKGFSEIFSETRKTPKKLAGRSSAGPPSLGPEGLLHNCTIYVNLPGIFLLRVTLASGETLPTRNLPSEALRPKCCLYEMPYYVIASVRETDDVIAHLQEPQFFFWFTSTRFSRDPSRYSSGSYVSFQRGSHMQEQYNQWTTLRT